MFLFTWVFFKFQNVSYFLDSLRILVLTVIIQPSVVSAACCPPHCAGIAVVGFELWSCGICPSWKDVLRRGCKDYWAQYAGEVVKPTRTCLSPFFASYLPVSLINRR